MAIKIGSKIDSGKTESEKKQSAESSGKVFGIILLLLLIVGLPIIISVWEIGAPIKGLSQS